MRIVTALCIFCLVGCGPYDDLRLFEVDAVEPSQIEPGGTLRIHGEGFPLGLSPVVILDGHLYRPGLPPVPLAARIPAEVENESRIEVAIDPALMRSIGGRGTFEGTMRLAFRSAAGRRDVFADYPLVLDFLPDTTTLLVAESPTDPHVDQIDASHFGVVLSREESGVVGVEVEAVRAGGPADQQGIRPGDTLVALDGLRLFGWRDFLPDPTRTQSEVSVVRNNLGGVHVLRWPHEATSARAGIAAQIAMVILGLLLGWRSPMLLCVNSPKPSSMQAWLTRASLILVFSAALFCVGTLQSMTLWIVALGCLAALYSYAAREPAVASSFPITLVSILTVMWLARTANLGSLLADQGSDVLGWYAFRAPASSFAFLGFLYTLGLSVDRSRLSASLYAAAASVFGAALFLGGWGTESPLEAVTWLVAKAAALAIVSRSVRMAQGTAVAILGLSVSCALAVSWIGLDPLQAYWGPFAIGAALAVLTRAVVPPLRRQSNPIVA